MNVHVPTPLRSYTSRQGQVQAQGTTLGELLHDINRQYPGFRFRIIDEQGRIREHIKLFVNQQQVRDLVVQLQPADEIHIICALSGG